MSGQRGGRLLALVISIVGVLIAPGPASASGGQVLLSDSFNGATTDAPLVSLNADTPGFPCLTAGTAVASPVTGCDLASPDPVGGGVLRLTDSNTSEASAVLYDTSFPTSAGLVITFDQYQYDSGGAGADGISFDLAVAPPQPTAIGPNGGALGYATNEGTSDPDGLPGGYLGVGLDTFGNFTNTFFDGSGCTDPSWAGSSQFPNEVTVRGPGDGTVGYCLLSSSLEDDPNPLGATGIQLSSSSVNRPAPQAIKIVIDPSSGTYTVGIDPTGGMNYQTVTSGTLPDSYYDPTTGQLVDGVPPRLTFALAASTGADTDIHEISNLNATTLNASVPVLTLSSTDSGGGFANANKSLTYSLVAGVSPSSPASENEPNTMVVTDSVPSDESIVGTPSGSGWNCSTSTSTMATCLNTTTPPLAPGATLPPISVDVQLGAAATGSTIINNAHLISDDAAAPVTGSDTVSVVVQAPASVRLTGPGSLTNGASGKLSGMLISNGAAVAAETLMFTVGTGASAQSCMSITGSGGTASCEIARVSQPATSSHVQVAVSWAGNPRWAAANASAPVALESSASCTLEPAGAKVRLRGRGVGRLTVDIRCQHTASVTLAGTVTVKLGKRSKTFKIRAVKSTAETGHKLALVFRLPAAALKGLKHHARESVTLRVTESRSGSVGLQTVALKRLRAVL